MSYYLMEIQCIGFYLKGIPYRYSLLFGNNVYLN